MALYKRAQTCVTSSPPLSVKPDLPDNYGEKSWEKLQVSIQAVFNQHPISYVLEELYQVVENMCSHGMASKLYLNLEAECRSHVMAAVPAFQQYVAFKIAFPLSVVFSGWLSATCSFSP